jgi:FAD/FMN-containing dehydrogenase
VGSINWGGLRDFGNVLRLRLMTMEAAPRALELTGEDLHKAVHAYGTNGIITEVEMPLTAHYDWVDVIVGFDSFDAAAAYALALGEQDGILKKLVTVVAGPTPHDCFLRHRALIPPGDSVVILMIAPHALDALKLSPALQRRADPARLEPCCARDARRPAPQLRTDLEPHDASRLTRRSTRHLPAGPLSDRWRA